MSEHYHQIIPEAIVDKIKGFFIHEEVVVELVHETADSD